MPPKRRGTRAKTMTKLSQEDQKKRVQCDLFLKVSLILKQEIIDPILRSTPAPRSSNLIIPLLSLSLLFLSIEITKQSKFSLQDFDQYRESVINESKREMETVIQSLTTTYKLELMKIPTDVKNSNWMEYYQSSINNGVDLLNVSNAINACIDDSICTKVGVFLAF